MKKIIRNAIIALSSVAISATCTALLGCNNDTEEEQEKFVEYTLDGFSYSVSGQGSFYIDVNDMSATDHLNYDAVIQSYGTKVNISDEHVEFVNGTTLSYYGKTGYILDGEKVIFFEPALTQIFNETKLSNGVFYFGVQIEVAGTAITYGFEYYSPNAVTPSYQVKFDSQGGSAVNTANVKRGDAVAKPTKPTKQGYDFVNWYADEKCTVEWNFTNKVYMNTTLYAKWTAARNNVRFMSNGGSSIDSQGVYTGDKVYKPSTPKKQGNTFEGWYSDKDLKTPYDFSETVTGNLTLYAKWTPNTYTITFNANGGICSTKTLTVTYGTRVKLPTPVCDGYEFDCWFDPDTGLTINSFDVYEFPYDIELYANWI